MKKNVRFLVRGVTGFFLLFFSASVLHAAPRGKQELVESGHWIYDAVTAISLEAGVRNFADTAPLTISELLMYLDEIDYDTLSKAGKRQWNRIHDYCTEETLTRSSDLFALSFDPSVNIEGYYKTESKIDWVYDRYSRNHLIELPVVMSIADYLTLGTEFHLGDNKGSMLHDDHYANIPTSGGEVDVNFPDYGYLSTGYKFTDSCGFTFQLGMGEQSIGRTQTGSIILSDYMTGASYGKYALYTPDFKYTYNALQLGVDKYMYYHLIDVRLFKKLTVSIMEATLTNAGFELRYANPLTVFHGMAPWRDYGDSDAHNAEFMGLKLDFALSRYLRLYGMFAMNQYQVPYERSNFSDDCTPNSLGGQLGLESYIPAGEGYVHFGLEGYYAQPTLYIKESPDWSFFRTYTDNIGDNAVFYEWTGNPFGPDTVAGELSIGYEKPSDWSLDLVYLFLCQGENADKNIFYDKKSKTWYSSTDGDNAKIAKTSGGGTLPDSWPYPTSANGISQYLETPTGTPRYTNRVSLRGKWQANRWLSFTFQPAYVIIFNYEHKTDNVKQGLECALAVTCRFSKIH